MNTQHWIIWAAVGLPVFFTIGGLFGARWHPGKWVALGIVCGPIMWLAILASTVAYAVKQTRLQQAKAAFEASGAQVHARTTVAPHVDLDPDALREMFVFHVEQAGHHTSIGGRMANAVAAKHQRWAQAIEPLIGDAK